MGNRLGSHRWGDPEATRINVEPAKDCKSLPAQPSVVVWPPSGVRGEKSSVKAHKREVSLITSPEGVLPLAAVPEFVRNPSGKNHNEKPPRNPNRKVKT